MITVRVYEFSLSAKFGGKHLFDYRTESIPRTGDLLYLPEVTQKVYYAVSRVVWTLPAEGVNLVVMPTEVERLL